MTDMSQEKRRERRIPIESVVLPFLGSRAEDYQPFQYLLQDISPGGVRVAAPNWAVSRERLHRGDKLHFHVPFRLGDDYLESGEVAWEKWDAENESQQIGASLNRSAPPFYPISIVLDSDTPSIDLGEFESPGEIFFRALKDSFLLKRGVLIYLKHLEVFFSRTSDLSEEDYAYFRETLLDDVIGKVRNHAERLEDWLSRLQGSGPVHDDSVSMLDMEELRSVMEPELYLDLFSFALGTDNATMYLRAIKELEKKLFSNYNTIVMLYIRTL